MSDRCLVLITDGRQFRSISQWLTLLMERDSIAAITKGEARAKKVSETAQNGEPTSTWSICCEWTSEMRARLSKRLAADGGGRCTMYVGLSTMYEAGREAEMVHHHPTRSIRVHQADNRLCSAVHSETMSDTALLLPSVPLLLRACRCQPL